MAYMRGEFYVWSDGDNMHINDVVMPDEVFDQLVAMRWARMDEQERATAREAAVENYSGNLGCVALCRELGRPSAIDMIKEIFERNEERRTS